MKQSNNQASAFYFYKHLFEYNIFGVSISDLFQINV